MKSLADVEQDQERFVARLRDIARECDLSVIEVGAVWRYPNRRAAAFHVLIETTEAVG